MIMAFFMSILGLIRFVTLPLTGNLHDTSSDNVPGSSSSELRHPSPTAPSCFSNTEVLSSVWKRLGELEDKIDVLQLKPNEMPYQKEELLNAAIYRVDALEAELISTKKVS